MLRKEGGPRFPAELPIQEILGLVIENFAVERLFWEKKEPSLAYHNRHFSRVTWACL